MNTIQPKKMLIINILDILKEYSDEFHRLSQKEIIEILEDKYMMKVDRKAVKRNLMNLIDFGYPIEYSESTRIGKSGLEESIYTDWYLNREFTDSELRLLIDSLLFSKHIPYNQCKDLIDKIKTLSNLYFSAKVKHICNLPENMQTNKQLFYTIDILDEAISKNCQVKFKYMEMDIDKELHLKLTEDNEPKEYIVNPYQMVATNGRYYLIGNLDKYDNVSHYRLDRIADITMEEGRVKPIKHVKSLENGLNLPTHMAEHIYMFSGGSVCVRFKAKRHVVGEIIDWFGVSTVFSNITDEDLEVMVTVNEDAMYYWLMQYGQSVEVLEPQRLRKKITETVRAMYIRYMPKT